MLANFKTKHDGSALLRTLCSALSCGVVGDFLGRLTHPRTIYGQINYYVVRTQRNYLQGLSHQLSPSPNECGAEMAAGSLGGSTRRKGGRKKEKHCSRPNKSNSSPYCLLPISVAAKSKTADWSSDSLDVMHPGLNAHRLISSAFLCFLLVLGSREP
ncbi:uncharacterized protein LY79DRAFT_102682 [Colletotrichum navitas]|uniref:Uncharacterized protein n=1 Tax=Colletotrichum navitas TaxID=681940 RepID=A0AAD8Q6L4_9PEZI|nr:uncharacterized protein LY79DRAFT_102682 [Colletotrichum navitas]KAK1595619.1 hypothetical protein LY79DRAFT_102682 [Colletotrichum navitas]